LWPKACLFPSATGSLAVQLAKKVFKASRVVGVAGSPEKLEYVKSIGADTAINYNSSTLEKDLVDATPGFVNALVKKRLH
jgi:NADPH-dependent curcumin reductase CurA